MLIIYSNTKRKRHQGQSKKCKSFQNQISYLGCQITDKGYGIDTSNIKVVTDLVTNEPS